MDYAVRKATELGVTAIQPLVTARSAPLPAGERGDKRARALAPGRVAACEQCGRNRIPGRRRRRVPSREWLAAWHGTGIVLLPDARQHACDAIPPPAAPLALADRPGRRIRRARRRGRAERGDSPRCGSARACCARTRRPRRRSPSCKRCGAIGDDAARSHRALLLAALRRRVAPRRRAMRSAPLRTTYAFVVLGEDGQAVARVITPAPRARRSSSTARASRWTSARGPRRLPQRPTRSDPALSKPSAFPVLVCDKAIPAASRARRSLGRRAAAAEAESATHRRHRRHRLPDQDFRQRVPGLRRSAQWPFAAVAAGAAAAAPDLVIHVGDYHYRENECPAGNAGCAGSPWGYGWDAWEADVFAPAEKLLAAAPWIVVRGNHESCNRGGPGLVALPRSAPASSAPNCDAAADDAIGDYSEPYAVPLGTGRDADTQFIVFDSSLVGVAPLPASDPMHVRYRAQFERAFALAARRPNAFFMNHHPILAFAPNPAKPDAPYPGNGALQSVLADAAADRAVPAEREGAPVRPRPSVRGRQLFDAAAGAIRLRQRRRLGRHAVAAAAAAGSRARARHGDRRAWSATNRFGFMTMERDGARWRMVAHDARGTPLIACTLDERQASCAPARLP